MKQQTSCNIIQEEEYSLTPCGFCYCVGLWDLLLFPQLIVGEMETTVT